MAITESTTAEEEPPGTPVNLRLALTTLTGPAGSTL